MPGINSNEVRLAPNGKVWLAVHGTALPTDPTTAPNAAFYDVGYLDESGVAITPSVTTNDIKAWQSAVPVKTTLTEAALELKCVMEQINQKTTSEFFFGSTWSVAAGVATLNVASSPSLNELSVIVDYTDDSGAANRLVVPHVIISARDAMNLVRNDATKVGLTFRALDESGNFAHFYSNNSVLLSS